MTPDYSKGPFANGANQNLQENDYPRPCRPCVNFVLTPLTKRTEIINCCNEYYIHFGYITKKTIEYEILLIPSHNDTHVSL